MNGSNRDRCVVIVEKVEQVIGEIDKLICNRII